MKKIILSVSLLLFLLPETYGSPVTANQAKQIAESFLETKSPRTKASAPVNLKMTWRLPDIRTDADLLYVFDDASTGGYVIVSGEDSAIPILGFSESGAFPSENMPPAMRGLLDFYGNVIRQARERNLTDTFSGESFDPNHVVRLETASWTQGSRYYPYNKYCPIIDGVQCPTGCVATAISIIMNYHRWPERGVGELPSYSYEYHGIKNTVQGHSLGHVYDWQAMNEQNDFDQIARLMYDVGVMVEMQYTPQLSGSYNSYVTRLSQYFGYDKDIRGYERRTCSDAQWENLIREEIDAQRPVLFGGFNSGSGHAMVIDGYSGRYFRINFGENGYSYKRGYSDPNHDGHWYTMTPIEGHERDWTAYYKGQDIYCNIKPDQGGQEPAWHAKVSVMGNIGLPYDFAVGKEFTLNPWARTEGPLTLTYGLFDQAGNLKERISETFTMPDTGPNGATSSPVICTIHKKPEPGDWIVPYFEIDGRIIIPRHNRFSEYRFSSQSLKDVAFVGFVTENEIDYVTGFLTKEIRIGYEDDRLRYLKDYLYFHCLKDFTWELLKTDNGKTEKIWGSEDQTQSPYDEWYVKDVSSDQTVKLRCMDLKNEEGCYHLIHLSPGDYILRLKNPLTGEKISINITV